MNIMYLIFSFNTGGIERLLIDLCNQMDKENEHVSLCVINDDYTPALLELFRPGVDVILLKRPIGGTLDNASMMLKFASIVKKRKIDILHCQGINCVFFSMFAKLYMPKLKVLNTVHDSGNYPSYSSSKIFLQNRICCHTIAISDSVRSEILKRHMSPAHVTTIYNAIDTSKFQVSFSGFDKDCIRIGNVARIFPRKKGQDTLVHAVELLKPRYPGIRCFFAGDVFKGQQEEFEKLKTYVKDHDLTDNIVFMGFIEDVPSVLKELDIFVLPSRYEGFGIALIEALSCGIPCVSSDIEGPKEIFSLSDIPMGKLFETGNAKALAAALSYVIDHMGEYDREAISAFVRQHFSIEEMTAKHIALYAKLLGRA